MNRSTPRVQPQLVEQNLALGAYLEALLSEKPMHLPVPVKPVEPVIVAEVVARVVEPVEVAAPTATLVDAVARTHAEADTVAPINTPPCVAAVASAHPAIQPVAPVAVAAAPGVAGTESEIPEWGRSPFQSLLLSVQGLTLALPLVKLNRILPWTTPTHLPGYVPWLLGIVRYLDQNVRVVDTAALVMPDRMSQCRERMDAQERRPEIVAARRAGAAGLAGTDGPDPSREGAVDSRHIVLIGDGRWALVCDDVSTVITIDPAKVRWRSSRTKRPWLAGTAVEHLCALLDAERLAELLDADCPELSRQS
jgi:purine-binding chemotaxis protein CheW